MEEFEAECLQGVQFGMDGKTLIHPKQIAGANRAFAPSDSEVAYCRRMIKAHAGNTQHSSVDNPIGFIVATLRDLST